MESAAASHARLRERVVFARTGDPGYRRERNFRAAGQLRRPEKEGSCSSLEVPELPQARFELGAAALEALPVGQALRFERFAVAL